VGKTNGAGSRLALRGEDNLITINMSVQEPHSVTLRLASGYVGYGEEACSPRNRRRPYACVLLDEIEKAHPDVLELFYQVFDKGRMEDGEGREIDFKNTIIVLTTNAVTDEIMELCSDPAKLPKPDQVVQEIKPEMNRIFKPAFLGRLVIVPYYPMRDEALKQIVALKMSKIERRMEETHRIRLTYDPEFIAVVVGRCTEVESGRGTSTTF
jgi:type VI secretion system protein VasG